MGYVHPDRPDIYVSYAHVDDEALDPNSSGCVSELLQWLRIGLSRALGRRDAVEFWRDTQLPRAEPTAGSLERKLEQAAVVLVILSSSYLESPWCQHIGSPVPQDSRHRASGITAIRHRDG